MDLRTLNYFVTVAEEQNITRAAEKLKICQPPLSTMIKGLEIELNNKLFIRGNRHLELTEPGKLLYRYAKEILLLANRTKNEILAVGDGISGTIYIGLVEGSAPNIAADWISTFANKNKDVNFFIVDGNSDELIDKLRSGIITLAVVAAPCDNTLLNSFVVGSEKMTAFMSKKNPLSKLPGNTIDLDLLRDQPLIIPTRKSVNTMIFKWFEEIDCSPRIICKMDNYLDVAALAGNNIGVSIFPKTSYISNKEIVVKEVVNPERSVDYLFVWLKGKPLSLADEAFIDHVKNFKK